MMGEIAKTYKTRAFAKDYVRECMDDPYILRNPDPFHPIANEYEIKTKIIGKLCDVELRSINYFSVIREIWDINIYENKDSATVF